MRIAFAVAMILVFSSASAYAQQLSFADLVIVHGHVWTVDPGNPRAEAVAIRDGQVGTPLPSHDWVDALTPDTPVFLSRYDGHMAMANALALRLAGITRETEDPPGGTVVRDRDGNPTGLLKDAAMDLVHRVIPPPSEEQLLRMVHIAMDEARTRRSDQHSRH